MFGFTHRQWPLSNPAKQSSSSDRGEHGASPNPRVVWTGVLGRGRLRGGSSCASRGSSSSASLQDQGLLGRGKQYAVSNHSSQMAGFFELLSLVCRIF